MLAVSKCCRTVVSVSCSVASLSAHWACSQASQACEDVLVYKGFLGKGHHDVADAENGTSVRLRSDNGGNRKTKDFPFHG
jgi:hypothetical protein